MNQPVKPSCLRCATPKKCAVHGCSPNTWPSEKNPTSKPPMLFNPYTGERRDSRDVESDPHGTLIIESFRDIPAASEGQS